MNKLLLPDNHKITFQRLEKRLTRDPGVVLAYVEIIDKYLDKGYVKKFIIILRRNLMLGGTFHILLWSCRKVCTITKTCMVFDASAKFNGVSLNDMICQGLKLQRELIDVLLRFRKYPFAIVCNIADMYLRIKLFPED